MAIVYDIHRSTTSGFQPSPATFVLTASSPPVNDNPPTGTYYYRVVARDTANGKTAVSNEFSVAVSGGAPTPEPPEPTPTGDLTETKDPLSHNIPTQQQRLDSPYKVGTHMFSTDVGPISTDNKAHPDYQDTKWLPPGGVESYTKADGTVVTTDHRPYGGLSRDRPIRRAPLTGDWKQADRRTDVRRMYDAGMDFCVCDVLGVIGSGSWTRVVGTFDATEQEGLSQWFKCAPMFDMTGGSMIGATQQQFVDMIKLLWAKPSCFKINGKMQITWFAPEKKVNQVGATSAVAFYKGITDKCAAIGIPIEHTFCYVATVFSANTDIALNPIARRHARWGLRNPVSTNSSDKTARGMQQEIWNRYAKPTMGNVSPGDVRARPTFGGNWNEQRGTEQFRTSWHAAMFGNGTAQGKCDWYQIITWNDWSETAMICPSRNLGWSLVDLNWYYVTWLKTGAPPLITKDCLYLSHKTQFSTGMTYTAPNFSNPLEHVGGTPPWDHIEVLAMITDHVNTTIEITTAAGMQVRTPTKSGMVAFSVPLVAGAAGSISAVMKRGGVAVPDTQITSPWAVSHTALVHDPSYRIGSSRRGWSSTYPDPNMPSQAITIT